MDAQGDIVEGKEPLQAQASCADRASIQAFLQLHVGLEALIVLVQFIFSRLLTTASQEAPGGPRRPQEAPGGPRRLQEAPGGSRRHQEAPGGTRRHQEAPGGPRRHQEAPGGSRRHQEASGGTRRHQEAPGGTRMHQEAPGGTRRLQKRIRKIALSTSISFSLIGHSCLVPVLCS